MANNQTEIDPGLAVGLKAAARHRPCGLPRGTIITLATPQAHSPASEAWTECRFGGRLLPMSLPLSFLDRLIARGEVEHDSGSGADPELHYRYEHYRVL